MNRFKDSIQTQPASEIRRAGCAVSLRRLIWPALVCMAVLVSQAAAQQDCGGKKAKRTVRAQKRVDSQKRVRDGTAKLTLAEKRKPRASQKTAAVPKPGKGGPPPRWVCKEPTLTMAPAWPGGQVECTFKIRNEGEGDLVIQAKGG